jgi:hypothetical protein
VFSTIRKLALSAHLLEYAKQQSFAPRCYQIFNIGMRIILPTNEKIKYDRCFAMIENAR